MEIFADDSRMVRTLGRAQRKLRAWGSMVTRMGAVVGGAAVGFAAPFTATVLAAADAGEMLSRFSAVFGDETEAAGRFADDLAERVGRSGTLIRDSMSSFQGFSLGLGFDDSAARGMSETLAELSLDFASFNNLTDADAAQRFISAMSGSSEVVAMYGINLKAAALDAQLLEMGIAGGTAKATEQQKALARLQIIMQSMTAQGAVGDATRTAGSFANQLKRLKSMTWDASVAIGRALIPVLEPVVAYLGDLAAWVEKVVTRNAELVGSIAKVVGVVAGVGAALIAVGGLITLVGMGFAGFAKILALIGGGISLVIGLFSGLGSVIAFLVTPIGLVGVAVVGLVTGFAHAAGLLGRAWELVQKQISGTATTAVAAFEGIRDALAAGDLKLAGRILWLGLQVEFERGVAALNELWQQGKTFFLDVWDNAAGSLARLFINAMAAIRSAWVESVAFLSKTWSGFTAGAREGWLTTQNMISKGVLRIMGLFDSEVDVEGASALLDEDLAKERAGIRTGAAAAAAESDRQRAEQLAAIEAQRSGAESAQRESQSAAEAKRAAAAAASNGKSQAALAAAQAEFQAALQAAAAGRAGGTSTDGDGDGDSLMDKLKGALAGLGGAAGADGAKVAGTFSATAAARSFGAVGPEQAIADATEKTAENTEKIAAALKGAGKLAFT